MIRVSQYGSVSNPAKCISPSWKALIKSLLDVSFLFTRDTHKNMTPPRVHYPIYYDHLILHTSCEPPFCIVIFILLSGLDPSYSCYFVASAARITTTYVLISRLVIKEGTGQVR